MRVAEFLCFYILAPAAAAVLLPTDMLFPALFALGAAGIVLLHLTAGFRWRELFQGFDRIRWPVILAMATAASAVGIPIIAIGHPEALFALPRARPELMAMIALLYPVLSVLPQEIAYRPLYFRRYGHLLPGGRAGLILNAAIFSLAHAIYWSWIAAAMSFLGGLIFAWAYETQRSFPLAVVLHSVAGVLFFAIGMGVYFYSGNAVRPF